MGRQCKKETMKGAKWERSGVDCGSCWKGRVDGADLIFKSKAHTQTTKEKGEIAEQTSGGRQSNHSASIDKKNLLVGPDHKCIVYLANMQGNGLYSSVHVLY